MSVKNYKGVLIAQGKKFGIIASRFNEFLTSKLLDGATDCLLRHGAREEDIEVYWTPGSFETPYLADRLARSKKYSAIVCLGVIIRGATPHFEIVCDAAARNIARVAIEHGLPVIFGIVTAENIEQAIERAGTKAGNRGWDAALTAIEMANLYEQI